MNSVVRMQQMPTYHIKSSFCLSYLLHMAFIGISVILSRSYQILEMQIFGENANFRL